MKELVPLLVPIVPGIVGAVGLMFKERRLSRNRRNVRNQALAEASAELAFASEWLKVHQLLGDDATAESTGKAREWLSEAEAKVTSTQHLSDKQSRPLTLRSMLLLGPTHKGSPSILRVLFWISAVWLSCLMVVYSIQAIENNPNQNVGGDIGASIIFTAVALGLRAWAEAANQPKSTRLPEVPQEDADGRGRG
jgi:hypothetical protein